MRIAKAFQGAETKKLFIPYLTVGDPSLAITKDLIKGLESLGAAILELGIPFSDPVGDGLVNQRSAERALQNKVNLRSCLALVQELRTEGCELPLLLFSYLNPILRMGFENFATEAARAGVDAVLVVDLPVEEALELRAALKHKGIGMVFLITPTTTRERILKTVALEPDFIYYVSRPGVTGMQQDLSASLAEEINSLRQYCKLPIAVGFGLSTVEQVRAVAKMADAVIVGSALVKELEAKDPHLAKQGFLQVAAELISGLS